MSRSSVSHACKPAASSLAASMTPSWLAPGAGTSHGSPYLYDRAVPLLVRAPGRVKAGVVRTRPVAFMAFARTAAALLDIPPPAAAAPGEDLTRR